MREYFHIRHPVLKLGRVVEYSGFDDHIIAIGLGQTIHGCTAITAEVIRDGFAAVGRRGNGFGRASDHLEFACRNQDVGAEVGPTYLLAVGTVAKDLLMIRNHFHFSVASARRLRGRFAHLWRILYLSIRKLLKRNFDLPAET
jgi:hypothetical protein